MQSNHLNQSNTSKVMLGAIICKNCGEVLGTQDTEKVTYYYGECLSDNCRTADMIREDENKDENND